MQHHHLPVHCPRHGGGHGVSAPWAHRRHRDPSDPPQPVRVLGVDDDGTVHVEDEGRPLELWHHDPCGARRLLGDLPRAVTYQRGVRLLHVAPPRHPMDRQSISLAPAPPRRLREPCWPADDVREAERRRTAGRDTFWVPLGAGGGVRPLIGALARKLAEVARRPDCHAVIVSLPARGAHIFTQTLVSARDGAWVEAVSNEFIDVEADRLSDDHHMLLAAHGFAPPGERSPNHHRIIDHPVDWAEVAEMLVAPLESVYGATAQSEVQVRIFEYP